MQELDFKEIARVNRAADETLENILSKDYYSFDQYAEVSKISDLEVAKVIIKRLLDKVAENENIEIKEKDE